MPEPVLSIAEQFALRANDPLRALAIPSSDLFVPLWIAAAAFSIAFAAGLLLRRPLGRTGGRFLAPRAPASLGG